MPSMPSFHPRRAVTALVLALALAVSTGGTVQAQQPMQVRMPVPSDQLVSFLPGTPMDQFIEQLNPIFIRVTGKRLVDPEDRTDAIGVAITGMHFIDAFEIVLDRKGLDFRESEGYFILEEPAPIVIAGTGSDGATAGSIGQAARPTGPTTLTGTVPDAAAARSIRIDAIIFELNSNRAREEGTNWGTLFGEAGSSESGQTGEDQTVPRLFFNTGGFFDALDAVLDGPDQVDFSFLLRLFRYVEERGLGETVANPSITTQSGVAGNITSGTTFFITTQDFAGNAIQQPIQTGTIINVTPTLVTERQEDGSLLDYVHMEVAVEKSTAQLGGTQPVISNNSANTQISLLDGEMDAIGGIFSQEESVVRRGVPVLKDIPVLRYLFSYSANSVVQKELIIVLRATVLDPVGERTVMARNIYEEERENTREALDAFRPGMGRSYDYIRSDEEVAREYDDN